MGDTGLPKRLATMGNIGLPKRLAMMGDTGLTKRLATMGDTGLPKRLATMGDTGLPKRLATMGDTGLPMAVPNFCWYTVFLNVKKVLFRTKSTSAMSSISSLVLSVKVVSFCSLVLSPQS